MLKHYHSKTVRMSSSWISRAKLLCACALSFMATDLLAQNTAVTGTVIDASGNAVVGASVVVKGTTGGTIAGVDGTFSIQVPAPTADKVLEVSFIGYNPVEVAVGNSTDLTVTLQEDAVNVDAVVITALGIKRAEKALSYNVQTVDGDALNTVKTANFVGSLAGKVAGVQINASSGPGGAVKVVSRGVKSIAGGNNVLYVVDGVPMHNTSSTVDMGSMSSQPGGEAIGDINSDDIESLSMLTGPAAAALYGYEGANGVVLITTKKGTTGKTVVSLSSNTTFSNPLMLPRFQNTYGNVAGSSESWGEKTSRRYDPAGFFRTGFNTTSGVTLQTGNAKNQAYFSAANTAADGILPNNTYARNNFALRYTAAFLQDKMTLDASANYISQSDKNMVSQGRYFNPITSVYLFPRGEDFDDVRMYQVLDTEKGLMTQNWNYGEFGIDAQNPYWIMNKMNRVTKKDRYMFTTSLKYDITDWLNVVGRVNLDKTDTRYTQEFHAGTIGTFANPNKGAYHFETRDDTQIYADLIANANKTFGDFNLFVNLGTSIKDYRNNTHREAGNISDAMFANKFSTEAIDRATMKIYNGGSRHQIQSVFANAELGWKGMLYLTLTGRNDWDSSLAYRGSTRGVSFFYPSVGLSGVISQMVDMPRWFDFAKVRFARTEVGNGLAAHAAYLDAYYTYNEQSNSYALSTSKGYIDPKPEKTTSYEIGADLRFFDGALTLDATWYLANTHNQTYNKNKSVVSDGTSTAKMQAGNVQNSGIELALGFNRKWNGLVWRTTLTYSFNKNTLKEMQFSENAADNFNEVAVLGETGGPVIRLTQGGTLSDLYIQRRHWQAYTDNGELYLNANGVPSLVASKDANGRDIYDKVGQMAAKSYAGWSNSFSYKGFELGIQLRGRFGGMVVSNTQAMLDRFGVSEYSAKLREQGGVNIHGTQVSAKGYLAATTLSGGLGKNYIYDATNIRLGEVSLSYELPRKWFRNALGMTVGVVANNLAMIYCKAPFDPEQVAAAGHTYYTGVDYFMLPSTRNIGFNVKLQF